MRKFILIAIVAGLAGIIIGGISIYYSVANLLRP
jgi:succinate-acetate transporter protein